MSICDPIGLGVAGLGRGFMLTLPSILADPHTVLTAAAAPRAESREAFETAFGGRAYETIEALAGDPAVEAVYVATPHPMHADHVRVLAHAGKHLLVEKPLAVTLEDAAAMVADAAAAGVHLIVGPSHSFDHPVAAARQLIEEGAFGPVRMIQAFNYTDFLYRPRRPEELVTAEGGGVIFSQAIHQIDLVRRLAGTRARSVFATTGAWDPARPTEGAYAAILSFEGGVFANLVYSGYAHFDSDLLQDGIGELGLPKDPAAYGRARRALAAIADPEEEARLKRTRSFGATKTPPAAPHAEHFGPVIVSCDRADLRLTPRGMEISGDETQRFVPTPPDPAPRSPVLKALYEAIRHGRPPVQTGAWGVASLEVCHALLESARTEMPIPLTRQG